MRAPQTTSSTETIQEQLTGLAPEAAMFVRDLVRGLEAEAGTARALSVRAELRAARADQRATRAEELRDEVVAREQALEGERDALRARVLELQSELEAARLMGRGRR